MKHLAILPLALAVAFSAGTHAADFTTPGATLAVGESAVVPLRVPYKPQVPAKLTVTSIDEGALTDFGQYKVPPEAADTRPYYVHYTLTALGDGDLGGLPLGYTLAVDDRNQTHTQTLLNSNFTGATFDRCKDANFRIGAGTGATITGCRIFLIHKNGSMKGFVFKEFETPYAKNPLIWTAGAPAPIAKPVTREAEVTPGR